MSEMLKNGHNGDAFETQDLSPRGVLYFMSGLAVLGVLIYFIIAGMYRFLDSYDRSHQAPMNPMAVKTVVDPQTMTFPEIQSQIDQTFPKPVLEHNEQSQFFQEVQKQDQTLESYDWVDQKDGVVRIPIERAIDLVAQRGLPVIPQGATERAAGAMKPGPRAKPGKVAVSPGKAEREGKQQ
jgi:hypothetical protein